MLLKELVRYLAIPVLWARRCHWRRSRHGKHWLCTSACRQIILCLALLDAACVFPTYVVKNSHYVPERVRRRKPVRKVRNTSLKVIYQSGICKRECLSQSSNRTFQNESSRAKTSNEGSRTEVHKRKCPNERPRIDVSKQSLRANIPQRKLPVERSQADAPK